ncbi:hypothetical protein KP509_31G006900 [Ceratopteris richardii]|nr:hypothetical protein KP509_31G006900 [Ceratopteris richardii]
MTINSHISHPISANGIHEASLRFSKKKRRMERRDDGRPFGDEWKRKTGKSASSRERGKRRKNSKSGRDENMVDLDAKVIDSVQAHGDGKAEGSSIRIERTQQIEIWSVLQKDARKRVQEFLYSPLEQQDSVKRGKRAKDKVLREVGSNSRAKIMDTPSEAQDGQKTGAAQMFLGADVALCSVRVLAQEDTINALCMEDEHAATLTDGHQSSRIGLMVEKSAELHKCGAQSGAVEFQITDSCASSKACEQNTLTEQDSCAAESAPIEHVEGHMIEKEPAFEPKVVLMDSWHENVQNASKEHGQSSLTSLDSCKAEPRPDEHVNNEVTEKGKADKPSDQVSNTKNVNQEPSQEDLKQREEKSFEFFFSFLEENIPLRELYIGNCNDGAFECLMCHTKMKKRYSSLVSLVTHASNVLRTKKLPEHRGYSRAICSLLGWDPHKLPNVPVRNSLSKNKAQTVPPVNSRVTSNEQSVGNTNKDAAAVDLKCTLSDTEGNRETLSVKGGCASATSPKQSSGDEDHVDKTHGFTNAASADIREIKEAIHDVEQERACDSHHIVEAMDALQKDNKMNVIQASIDHATMVLLKSSDIKKQKESGFDGVIGGNALTPVIQARGDTMDAVEDVLHG